jgi:hypothetical protein
MVVLAAATVPHLSCSDTGDGGGNGAAGDGGASGDGGWLPLGGPVTDSRPVHLSLTHDGVNPVVAWVEQEDFGYQVYTKRWNGTSWVQLGGALTDGPTSIPGTAEVAVDRARQPVVAFNDLAQVYVRRWDDNNKTWGVPSAPADGIAPWLVMNGDTALVSMRDDAGELFVRSWTETLGWAAMGGALNAIEDLAAAGSRIALDRGGSPVVAFTQHESASDSNTRVYAKRWEGGDWVELGPTGFPNPDHTRRASVDSLAIIGEEIFVAWTDSMISPRNAYVMHWTTNDPVWRQMGPALASVEKGAFYPSMSVRAAGEPMVALVTSEPAFCLPLVVVKRWDGSDWEQVGDALNETNCSCDDGTCEPVNLVSMALDGSGTPVVAWVGRHGPVPNAGSIYVKTLRL